MWKLIILCSLFAVSFAGIIHDAEPSASETDHHHNIDHEHATSHQSFKFHHHHAVPMYVKKADQHLLKNPIEVGGIKHKLKVLHPKIVPHHSHGRTLENHIEDKDFRSHGFENHQHYQTAENREFNDNDNRGGDGNNGQELNHQQFQDINVHHGHGAGGNE